MFINILIFFYAVTLIIARVQIARNDLPKIYLTILSTITSTFWSLLLINIVFAIKALPSSLPFSNWSVRAFIINCFIAIAYQRYLIAVIKEKKSSK